MHEAPPIRLVALDIDGTLLTSTKQITPATLSAVQDLTARGVQVVLASARSPTALRLLMAELSISGYAISYTGALLCRLIPDAPTDVLAEQRMPLASARSVLHGAMERGLSVGWYVSDNAYIRGWDDALRYEYGVTGEQPIVKPDLLDIDEAPHKILCIAGSTDRVPELERLAHDVPADCVAQFSHTTYLEVTHRSVNKADALVTLGRLLSIDLAEMAAMGDQANDVEMIRRAGVGIAMGNAITAVHAGADWATETNDRDGVAVAIARLREAGRLFDGEKQA